MVSYAWIEMNKDPLAVAGQAHVFTVSALLTILTSLFLLIKYGMEYLLCAYGICG